MRWPEPLPAQRSQIPEDLFVSLSRTRQLAHLQTHIPLPRVGLVKNDGARQQATASARLTQDDVETSGVRCSQEMRSASFYLPRSRAGISTLAIAAWLLWCHRA